MALAVQSVGRIPENSGLGVVDLTETDEDGLHKYADLW